MPNKTINLENYVVTHYIGSEYTAVYSITVYSNGIFQGWLSFLPSGSLLKSTINVNGQFDIRFDVSKFQDIITTIRYEKPIEIVINWDANNVITSGWIRTSTKELVGEQEAV